MGGPESIAHAQADGAALSTPASDPPIITTVIPTWRRPAMLRRAVRSVLAQSYPHLQVLVCDNASGDETAAVVAELASSDPRVRYICHAENIGMTRNFNAGLRAVETPFFSLLSDDDVLLPHFYETVLKGFEQFPDARWSAGTTVRMTGSGEVLAAPVLQWKREGRYDPPEGMLNLLDGNHPDWTGVVFRRDVLSEVGLLDEHVGPAFDLDLLMRTATSFPYVISHTCVAIFTVHATSSCGTATWRFFWPGWREIVRHVTEHPTLPAGVKARGAEMLTVYLRTQLRGLARQALECGNHLDMRTIGRILEEGCNDAIVGRSLQLAAWIAQHHGGIYNALWRAVRAAHLRLRRPVIVNVARQRTALAERFAHLAHYLDV